MKIHYKNISVVDNIATGADVRHAREKAQKSLRSVAAAANISAPYLSDLERGHRTWTISLFNKIRNAVEGK